MGAHIVQILPRPGRITLQLVRLRKLKRGLKLRISGGLVIAVGVAADVAVLHTRQDHEENEERCEQQHHDQHHRLPLGREVPVLRQRELFLPGTAVGGREVHREGAAPGHAGWWRCRHFKRVAGEALGRATEVAYRGGVSGRVLWREVAS